MNRTLKSIFCAAALAVFAAALPASAQQKKGDGAHTAAEIKKDIADHRAMAEAHLRAAKCLESGQPDKECRAQLTKDCKGLAIGKYCGLQHRH